MQVTKNVRATSETSTTSGEILLHEFISYSFNHLLFDTIKELSKIVFLLNLAFYHTEKISFFIK